jgi:sporulation protein YlmC with PRC-barrel domain
LFTINVRFYKGETDDEIEFDCCGCGNSVGHCASRLRAIRCGAERRRRCHKSNRTQIQNDQIRASKMLGSTVYDLQNRDIGSVKDLIIDKDGRVAAAVIDVGTFLGMGGKYVAVPLDAIKTDNNRLTLDMTKEQLQQAQAYNLANSNTGAGSTTSPVSGGHLGSASGTSR